MMPAPVDPGGEGPWEPWESLGDLGHHLGVHPPPHKHSKGPGQVGPGPQKQPSLHDSTHPAHGLFDDYSGPQVDAAKAIVKAEMALLGWPQSVDTEQMALDLLKNNLENRPQDAFEHFWNSKFITNDMKKASPWARFGMDADTFHQNLASTQDLIKRMTGMDITLDLGLTGKTTDPTLGMSGFRSDPMAMLLQAALKGGWSQQQILDALQAGSFQSLEGKKVDLTGVTAAEPWLLSGQTYQQEAQQFRTIYGAAPVDTAQLAGWFRFNQAAAQIGPWYARQAVTEAVSKTPLGSSQSIVR